MIRTREVANKLLKLIGFKDDYSSQDCRLDSRIEAGTKKLQVQRVHPALTIQNLKSVSPDFKMYVYPDYDSTVHYQEGQKVKSGNKIYVSLKNENHDKPLSDKNHWFEVYTDFSQWLYEKLSEYISASVDEIFQSKLYDKSVKSLIENRYLFSSAALINNQVEPADRLVGFMLKPSKSSMMVIKLNKIALQFTKLGVYKLYIYHSSAVEPIKELELSKNKNFTSEWFEQEDLYLYQDGSNGDSGGAFFVCYKESELPEESKAIFVTRDWRNIPCLTCNSGEYLSFKAINRFIEVSPVSFKTEEFNTSEITLEQYNNFGLNLDISAMCDLTDFMVKHIDLYKQVVLKRVGIEFLKLIAYNPDANVSRNRNSLDKEKIMYALDGDSRSNKKSGLIAEYLKDLQGLNFNTSSIDRICQRSGNNGLKYKHV